MFSPEYEQIWSNASIIPGYLSKMEGYILYQSAQFLLVSGDLLEIGSYCGKSTVILGSAIKKHNHGKHLYTIDNFVKQNSSLFPDVTNPKKYLLDSLDNFSLNDYVSLIEADSIDAINSLNKSFGLIFFDGEHTKKKIEEEICAIKSKVVPGGKLIFHDVGNIHVDSQYTEYLKDSFLGSNNCIYIMESSPRHSGNGILITEVKNEK